MNINQFKRILIYDHHHSLDEHMNVDLNLLDQCNKDDLLVRFWTSSGVVFGKLDTTLVNFELARQYLHNQHIETTIRKSGGLAVFLDDQTLNISLIISKRNFKIDLHDGYKKTVELLGDFLKNYNVSIRTKEVVDSYCPGKYDCVIDDYKFCGIAQFQKKDHMVIMLNMVIAGNQKQRLNTLKEFYTRANPSNNPTFPQISEDSMKTLKDLTHLDLSTDQVINDFKDYLHKINNNVHAIEKIQLEIK